MKLPPPPSILPPPGHAPGGVGARGRGRPKGSRNKRTLLVEKMLEGELENMVTVLLRLAQEGDTRALIEVLSRIAPARKGAVITIDGFPRITSVHDVPAALARLAEGVAAGAISPEEAQAVATVLNQFVNAAETVELHQRVTALENRYAENQ